MRLRIKNKVTQKRLGILAALIFAEAFFTPINGILSQGAWPTPVQVAWCCTTGILQVVTVLGGLLETS